MEAFSTQSLENLLLLTALGALISALLARLRLPVVSGLLLAGALLGPQGFALVRNTELIQVLSKVGVVLLMFTIGLALSPKDLQRHARVMALGGLAQVGLTLLFTAALAVGLGFRLGQSVFLGMVVALSSTAIVLRGLSDRNELHAPHGRLITGALLFQDLTVVPMLVVLPALGRGLGNVVPLQALEAAGESAAILGLVWFGGRKAVPFYFRRVAKVEGNDVFLLSLCALILGACWLSARAGLSTALGAFLAGILLSDSGMGEKTLAQVLPFREISQAVFFLSLGMLFDPRACMAQGRAFIGLLALFTVGKALLAGLAARMMGFPVKVAALTGVGLGQFSEFGYVLLQGGLFYGVLGAPAATLILSAGIASMLLTPLALRGAPRGRKGLSPAGTAARNARRGPGPRRRGTRAPGRAPAGLEQRGHGAGRAPGPPWNALPGPGQRPVRGGPGPCAGAPRDLWRRAQRRSAWLRRRGWGQGGGQPAARGPDRLRLRCPGQGQAGPGPAGLGAGFRQESGSVPFPGAGPSGGRRPCARRAPAP